MAVSEVDMLLNIERALKETLSVNLRTLTAGCSVSEVCRQIGISRTQFNRYLYGEQLPALPILAVIAGYFETDCRLATHRLEVFDRRYCGAG